MSEKRFILKSDYDQWGVVDTTGEIKGEYNECFSTDTVVDLLNALHEECLQYLNIIGDLRVYAKENDIENILKIINKLEMELIENV